MCASADTMHMTAHELLSLCFHLDFVHGMFSCSYVSFHENLCIIVAVMLVLVLEKTRWWLMNLLKHSEYHGVGLLSSCIRILYEYRK